MKSVRIILLSAILLIATLTKTACAQERKIHFVQFGDTIQEQNGMIQLERQYFDIRLHLKNKDELVMNMSADSTTYHLIKSGVPIDSFNWFRNGTGLLNHPDYRMNWLLFDKTDYMSWTYKYGMENTARYRDSSVKKGYVVSRTITSFDFTNEGGIDGDYSIYIVPVTYLYVVYYVKYKGCFRRKKRTPVTAVKIRVMGL